MTDNTKSSLAWSIRIIISFLFLLSAVAKMYPSPYFAISTFEVKQLYPMGFSESFAPYFSRILIGIEFALGLLILQKHFLRNIVIPATLLMLAVFTTHLSIETFMQGGNTGNCGCFGSLLPMTPIEAIIKNVVAMALLVYLLKVLPKSQSVNGNIWILLTGLFASVLMVFMAAPIQPATPEFTVNETADTVVDSLTAAEPTVIETPKTDTVQAKPAEAIPAEVAKPEAVEPPKTKSGYAQFFPSIDKGRKTLCFFVPGCDHCMEAAKELTELRKKDKNFPEINIVFMNEEPEKIPAFFEFAGAEYPYKIIEIIPFWKVLGQGKDTPGVKYLWNGNSYVYYWGISENKFNAAEYHKITKKTFAELKNTNP